MKIADCAIDVHMSVTKVALISSLRNSVFIEPVVGQDRIDRREGGGGERSRRSAPP
jgi:hypothetical protein